MAHARRAAATGPRGAAAWRVHDIGTISDLGAIMDPKPQDDSAEGTPRRPLSLSDRVRSLRLSNRPAARPARRAWLPWSLCAVLASTTLLFALRPHDTADAAKDQDRGTRATRPTEQPAEGGSGGIALTANGNIIP